MAKEAFNNKKVLLTKNLMKDVKKKIAQAVVWMECDLVWSRNMDTTKGRCKEIGSL